jgi:outer membrane protein OmpA-like peptidoglycan-associated protein
MARRNTESCRWCPWVAAAAVSLVGWFGFVRGEARPELLRQRTEAAANRDLAGAGFAWAQLRVDGDTARLIGRAPSEQARDAALAAAPALLARFMGVPGVFEQLLPQVDVASAAEQRAVREAQIALLRSGADIDLPPTSAGPATRPAALPAPALSSAPAGASGAGSAAGVAAGVAGEVGGEITAGAPAAGGNLKFAAAVPAAAPARAPVAATAAELAAGALTRPDPACQRELIALQQRTVLRFMPAAATLDVGQDDALDSLAALLRRCSAGRVLVHGLREPLHSAGPSASATPDALVPGGGLLLAQRRAQAVRAELIARGVALPRLQLGAGAREVAGDAPARVELTLAPMERS